MNRQGACEERAEPVEAWKKDLVEARCPALLFSLAAVLFFAVGVIVYARRGGPWVDGLDDRLGDVVTGRAHSLAEAGRTEEAIEAYQRGLSLPFDTPDNRKHRALELARLCIEADRCDEAVDAAFMAYREADWVVGFRELIEKLLHEKRFEEALSCADRWLAKAEDDPARSIGMLYKGAACHRLGRADEAAALVLESFHLNPSTETASVGARILRDLRRPEEVGPLLQFIEEHGSEALKREAEQIRQQLPPGGLPMAPPRKFQGKP